MTVRDRLESALLQPEGIAQSLGRFDDVFLAGFSLRLIGLVADRTAFWRRGLFVLKQRVHKRRATVRIQSHDINVLIMRKADTEFGHELSALEFWIYNIAQTGKEPARGVSRRHRDMAIRADQRRRPFACKELRAMTAQAGRMFRKICYVCEGRITLAHILPILRRDLVTGIAREFLRHCVSGMRELCVIDFRFGWDLRFLRSGALCSFLRRQTRTSGCDDNKERYRRHDNYCPR